MTPRPFLGALRLAVGRKDGIELIGDSVPAFLASLAPLIAFPLVGSALLAISGKLSLGIALLLLSMVAQLGPAVVSHALAARWGREAAWLRYATAFNWCQWALPMAGMALLVMMQLLIGDRLSAPAASEILILAIAVYGLWLNWLLARAGLGLEAGRAAGFVLLVNLAVLLLVALPQWLAGLAQ